MEFGSKRTRWTGREAGGWEASQATQTSRCVSVPQTDRQRSKTPKLLQCLMISCIISVTFPWIFLMSCHAVSHYPLAISAALLQASLLLRNECCLFLRELELEFSSFFWSCDTTCWAVGWCSPSPTHHHQTSSHQPTVPMTPHLSSLFEL